MNSAAPYAVLGTNAVATSGTVTCTNTGAGSTINGRVGTTFTSITNTACTISGPIDAPVGGGVVTDFNTAFAAVTTQNPVCTGVIPTTSTTLAPGVYCSAAGTTLGAGVILTLNGTANDVWVFRVGTGGPGALTLNSAQVVMGGAALACNVFWKTSAAATLTDSTFNGTVLSGAGVTMTRGSWTGRALATTDATVTDAATMTFAGCSAPAVPTIAKAFSPTSIGVGGVSRLTITLNNPNASAISLNSAFTDTLPGGVVIAAAPNPVTTCGGAATAVAGASTVSLATASTIPGGSCTIAVNVTAAAAGVYVNTIPAGALQTNTGNNPAPATATLTVSVCPLITLSPATLPVGKLGVAYSQQITASGGAGPYTFSVSSGTLPAGLTLTAAGVLAGTPTTLGSSTVAIKATDGNTCPGVITYVIVVAPATCPVITLAPATLPDGSVGVAYSQQITASGGSGATTFSVLSGTLPAGLTLTPAGLLAGNPTTAVTSTVVIQGADGNGCPGVISYTITVAAGVPTLPQAFLLWLALGLLAVGYFRLRGRARAE